MHRILLFIITLFITTLTFADELIIEPNNGRAPIINAINNAKSSIDLIMYGLTDPALIRALIHAKNAGKNVTVLLEPHPYESENENTLAINLLKNANIPVETPNPTFQLTHEKTLIIDNNEAFIMTFNFTRSSFSTERNFALVINNPNEIQEIKNVMRADSEHKNIAVKEPDLIFSPNNSRAKLMSFIQNAKSTIKIYAQDISDYQIIGALAKAAKNNITVEIITSSTLTSKNKNKYAYLTRAGVVLHFRKNYYIHAKVIIIDNKAAILGSINLSQPSIEDNRELSIITTNPAIIQTLNSQFKQDFS